MRNSNLAPDFGYCEERIVAAPSDAAMERAVIGDMLVDAEAAQGLAALLTAGDFTDGRASRLFEELSRRVASGESLNLVVLTSRGVLTQNEVAGYVGATNSALSWRAHAQVLREMRQRRAFLQAARYLEQAADDRNSDTAAVLADVWAELTKASRMALTANSDPDAVLGAYETEVRSWEGLPLANTGIKLLDSAIGGGMLPGELMAIIGGDGSMKTSLALACAESYLRNVGRGVLYLSLDMQPHKIALRRLLPLADTGEKELLNMMIRGESLYSTARANRAKIDKGRFHLAGGPLDLKGIEALVNRLRPGLVIWDYLTATAGFESELEAQRTCTEKIREWQQRYDATWIVLSQMSEIAKAGQRNGDFTGRASGGNSLARNCDTIIELFLDAQPDENPELGYYRNPPLIAMVVKCRSGRKGSCWSLRYNGASMSFTGDAVAVERVKKRKPVYRI